MEVVDLLLKGTSREAVQAAQVELTSFVEELSAQLDQVGGNDCEGMEIQIPEGLGSGVSSQLQCPSGISFLFSLEYESVEEDSEAISGSVNLTELPPALIAELQKRAFAVGFEQEDEGIPWDEGMAGFLVYRDLKKPTGANDSGRRIWSLSDFAETVLDLERAARNLKSAG